MIKYIHRNTLKLNTSFYSGLNKYLFIVLMFNVKYKYKTTRVISRAEG